MAIRWRAWRWLLLTLVMLLALAWWLAPSLAVRWAQPRLPWAVDEHTTIIALSTSAAAVSEPLPIDVALSAARARALGSAMCDMWVPPWLLRDGLHADGRTGLPQWPDGAVTWRARLDDAEVRPAVTVRLHADAVNTLLTAIQAKGSSNPDSDDPDVEIASLSIVDADTPAPDTLRRQLRVRGAGTVRTQVFGLRLGLPVRELTATVQLGFARAPDGIQLISGSLHCEQVELELPDVPAEQRQALINTVETLVDGALAEVIAKKEALPHWLPLDTRIDARIAP